MSAASTEAEGLGDENAKLKKLLAEAMLDSAILKDAASKNGAAARRDAVTHLCEEHDVSQRRACAILAVVNDFARECLALVADTSLSGLRVTRELDIVMALRGRPRTIVSDNGTELTAMAILR